MDIVFLDQNKWIDLAKVEAGTSSSPEHSEVYAEFVSAVESGKALFPLSMSNILETAKRGDPKSRRNLAVTQARLSKGRVFRSRKARILVETRLALLRIFEIQEIALPQHWFIAPDFYQAFEPFDELVSTEPDAAKARLLNRYLDPQEQYVAFMTGQDEAGRRAGLESFSEGSNALVQRIEARRKEMEPLSKEMRLRAYAAKLFYDHQGYTAHQLNSIGRSVEQFKALGPEYITRLVSDVATLNVELQLGIRLESQSRAIESNDLRDMHSFCAATPYASHMCAEKTFVKLARQCGLDTSYGTEMHEKLSDMKSIYSR